MVRLLTLAFCLLFIGILGQCTPVSREVGIYIPPVQPAFENSIAREFTVHVAPSEYATVHPVGREFTVFVEESDSQADPLDAVAREFTVFVEGGETPTPTITPDSGPSPSPTPVSAEPLLVSVQPDERFPMSVGGNRVGFYYSVAMATGTDPLVHANRVALPSDPIPLDEDFRITASPGWVGPQVWYGAATIANGTPNGPYRLRVSGARTLLGATLPDDLLHNVRVSKDIATTTGVVSATMANALLVDWDLPPDLKGSDPVFASSKIFRSTEEASGPYEQIARVNAPDSEYLDFGLPPNTVFYYQVVVFNSALEEVERTLPFSGQTKANNAYVVVVSTRELEIHWDPSVGDALIQTRILRGKFPAPPTLPVASLEPSDELIGAYPDTQLEAGTLYTYQIVEVLLISGQPVERELIRPIQGRTLDLVGESGSDPNYAMLPRSLLALLRSIRAKESLPSELIDYALFWRP